jgi:hypothetical protein
MHSIGFRHFRGLRNLELPDSHVCERFMGDPFVTIVIINRRVNVIRVMNGQWRAQECDIEGGGECHK